MSTLWVLRILFQLQESETKLNKSLQQCKNVEFELEEAMSRKKVRTKLTAGWCF